MAAYFFEIINIKVKIELSLASYFVVFLSTSKLTDTPEVSIEKASHNIYSTCISVSSGNLVEYTKLRFFTYIFLRQKH